MPVDVAGLGCGACGPGFQLKDLGSWRDCTKIRNPNIEYVVITVNPYNKAL